MSTQTTTYSTVGTYTYTAPSTLVGGTVTVSVAGAPGGSNGLQPLGKGGEVSAVVTLAAGAQLTVYVGNHSAGGNGSSHTVSGQAPGQPGGASSAIVLVSGSTLLIEAGGGGGAGGNAPFAVGGLGGSGGASFTNGLSGGVYNSGTQLYGGGGGGGGGHQGAGSTAPRGTTDYFGSAGVGTAGDEYSTIPAGANAGGGGGAGGSSYAAASGVGSVVFNDGSSTAANVTITAIVADPPLAPTLTSPVNGTYQDPNTAGQTFTWTYNKGTNSGNQQNYSLRISQDGAAYKYWTGSTLTSTPTWVTSSTASASIGSGILADGHTYTWSVATEDTNSLQGPFATDIAFTAIAAPTILALTEVASGGVPTVSWSDSLPGGTTQTSYRVVIYTTAQTGAPGFSPGVTAGTLDSGTQSSSSTIWTAGSALPTGSYVVYVQITATGPITSTWTSYSFTVTAYTPSPPGLTATTGNDGTTGAPIITLVVQAEDNLLSTQDSIDYVDATSGGSWTAGSNTTLAFTSQLITVTATASGTISASTSNTAAAVTGGNSYAAMVTLETTSTGRSCTLGIAWYNSSNTLISTTTGSAVNDGAVVSAYASGAAPSTATHAQLVVTITGCGASEVHDIFNATLIPGATNPPSWSRGGLVGLQTATVTYSDDGGNTWNSLRGGSTVSVPANTQQVTLIDREAPLGVERQYQAVISANTGLSFPGIIVSHPPSTANATLPSSNGWLTDPLDSTIALKLQRLATSGSTTQQFDTVAATTNIQVPVSLEFDSTEQMGVFYGWGNADPIVQRGTVLAKQFTIAAYVTGSANYAIWQSLVGRVPMSNGQIRQHTLLWRDDMGNSWYVVVGPGIADQLLRAPDRTTNPQWSVTLPCIVTTKP